MNEKFKLYFVDDEGNQKSFTENHPKLDSTDQDKEDAMTGVCNVYGLTSVRIDLQSDTTIWQAE